MYTRDFTIIDDYTSEYSLASMDHHALTEIVSPLLDNAGRYALSRVFSKTSVYGKAHEKRLYRFFKIGASEYVCDFLKAAIGGDEATVLVMLKRQPELLLESAIPLKNHEPNLYGKKYSGMTVLQILLCELDTDMAEKVMPYFSEIYPDDEKRKKVIEGQIKAIFPNGYKAHIEQREKRVFNFNNIATVIENAPIADVQDELNKRNSDSSLSLELEKFRIAFNEHMLSEKIFNPNNCLAAATKSQLLRPKEWQQRSSLYWKPLSSDERKIFDQCDAACTAREKLFFIRVFGYTLRYFTACAAQRTMQNVYYENIFHHSPEYHFPAAGGSKEGWTQVEVHAHKELLIRSFKSSKYPNLVFIPCPYIDADIGLGYDYGLSGYVYINRDDYTSGHHPELNFFFLLFSTMDNNMANFINAFLNPGYRCVIQ